ncbi:molybdenum ABC transporter ATP-binding protein [Hoeflea sp. CAU 1731]
MSEEANIHVALSGRLGDFDLDVTFDALGHGLTALFGPSGCGKTTILRCIAGLDRLAGACRIGEDTWQDEMRFTPTHKRAVGYVFQEASLFPHLSVRDNLLFSTGGRAQSTASGGVGFEEVVELLDLDRLMQRGPQRLSGGERQRVAVGRALLSQPRILLMDEPLSALDRQSRDEILPFLERLHRLLAIPVFYVTHDMSEVERLADHLILLDAGRVVASGPLGALQSDTNLPLALRRGAAVTLDAVVSDYDAAYGLTRFDVRGGSFLIPGSSDIPAGSRQRLRIGASDVSLALEKPTSTSILNVLPATISSSRTLDDREMVMVLTLGHDSNGEQLLARITRRSWDLLELEDGRPVFAQIKSAALAPRRLPQ